MPGTTHGCLEAWRNDSLTWLERIAEMSVLSLADTAGPLFWWLILSKFFHKCWTDLVNKKDKVNKEQHSKGWKNTKALQRSFVSTPYKGWVNLEHKVHPGRDFWRNTDSPANGESGKLNHLPPALFDHHLCQFQESLHEMTRWYEELNVQNASRTTMTGPHWHSHQTKHWSLEMVYHTLDFQLTTIAAKTAAATAAMYQLPATVAERFELRTFLQALDLFQSKRQCLRHLPRRTSPRGDEIIKCWVGWATHFEKYAQVKLDHETPNSD